MHIYELHEYQSNSNYFLINIYFYTIKIEFIPVLLCFWFQIRFQDKRIFNN